MRAFIGHDLGELDGFSVEEAEIAEPEAGELRVTVEAAALGFVDQLVMRGLYQVKPPLPFVPGGEIVGSVESIGAGVNGFQIGQRVASWQYGGGLADMAILRSAHTVVVPDDVGSPAAAAILLDYLTAYYALFDRGGLKPGQRLLITGASGGVGTAAVQLAHASGAVVIGLASGSAKRRHVREIGADCVLDYRETEWRAQLKALYSGGVDMVFDPVGGPLFEPCFRSLAKRGRHLVVGFAAGGAIASLPANLALLKSGELVGVDARYLWESDAQRVREILSLLLGMAARGAIAPVIAQTFALNDAAEAIAMLSDGDRIGKIVVRR